MESTNSHREPKYIVVVGASAGGLNAIAELVSQLTPEMDVAVLVVLHLSRKGISNFLAHKVQQHTGFHCVIASDGGVIQRGHIYIASPNYHLLVKNGRTMIGHGPEENRWRPSIDVLFRSAAVHYGVRTIGIILTGLLDDGASGMQAIRKSGGICIVQDPNEAEYPDMPLAVLNSMEVDHCISLAEIGPIISEISSRDIPHHVQIPEDLRSEAEIAEKASIGIDIVSQLGDKSIYTCPDCGGGLWKLSNEKMDRYRCHIGHSYSERDLVIKQAEHLESTLWVALRIMEERRNLLKKMEEDTRRKGFMRIASDHGDRGEELQSHINKLKGMLFDLQETDHT